MSTQQQAEQPQQVNRLDVLIQNFKDFKDNDDKCLKLLHELFELMEHLTLNGAVFEANMEQIAVNILPLIIEKVKATPPQFVDNLRNRLRKQTLEIFSIIPFPDHYEKLPLPQIIEFVLTVIDKDNEDNAELALKLLYEFQKFYRTSYYVLTDVQQGQDRLLSLYLRLLSNLNERLNDAGLTQEDLMKKRVLELAQLPEGGMLPGQQQKIIISSEKSMKTLVHFNAYYLWVNQIIPEATIGKQTQTILIHIVQHVLAPFAQRTNVLSQVKNVSLYLEYLEGLRNSINFFNFIVKKTQRANSQTYIDLFVEHFPILVQAEINILRHLHQMGTQGIRNDILNFLKQQLLDIAQLEKNDKTSIGQNQQLRILRVDKNYYTQKNQALKALYEDFLVKSTLAGLGKQSKDVSQISRQIQQNYIMMMYREHFTIQNLKHAIQLIQRQMLDRTISFSLRGQMIVNLYRLMDDLKQRKNDTLQDYSDLLENFAHQNKLLDYQMKVMSQEYKQMKGEIADLRKTSRIRMNNDNEQKQSEIRNILIADGGAYFVDLSKEKSLPGGQENVEKFKHDYQYYFLHDYKPLNNLGDVTHQKENKYSFLLQYNDSQLHEYMESNKEENCLRLIKNTISFQEQLLSSIIEKQQSNYFKYREVKSLRKILIHGGNVVHYLCDMYIMNQPGQPLQFQTNNDRNKVYEIIKKFSKLFFVMLPLQFRDLIASVEDKFLGRVLETQATTGDTGIFLLVENMMQFQPQNIQNQQRQGQPPQPQVPMGPAFLNYQDDISAHLNELFFNFICKKMRIFNRPIGNEPGEKLLTTNKLDQRLAQIPTAELQDTIQKLALIIGEKALSKKNDQRMKHLFFSVFIFCIKYTKTNKIIPYYFQVIKNTFKSLNNMSDNTNFVKEFTPMIQGLLETFLQAKEDASYIKETNELCYQIPVKLKSLIEFIPSMSRPLIDSMKLNQVDIIENGITTIQMWVSALSSYPEILDPILDNMLPELNSFLQKMNCVLPNLTLKLLGKLSAKTRIYSEEKEIRAKNYPEEGLKVGLEDKSTGQEIVLPLDSAIGTILIKVFDQYHKYSEEKLIQAYKLVKSCFLCYVEPNHDIDYLVLSIINAKNRNTQLLTQYAMNSTRFFDSRRQQQKLSIMARGSEQHGFEKILKSILIASTIPKTYVEAKVFREKIKKFFNWVTQYFTLIYICKNGKLNECLANEINPLIFIDDLCEFLYFNVVQNTPKSMQRSYIQGPIRAIKNMIRLVKDVYSTQTQQELEQTFLNMEFIQTLVKKICHVAYSSELPNKVAMNLAFQSLIQELPSSFIKVHCSMILDAVFHTMNISQENIIYQVEKECRKTIDMILEKIGFFNPYGVKEQDFKNQILDKIMINFYSTKSPARQMAMQFVERIASKWKETSVRDLVNNALRPQREQPAGNQAMHQQSDLERSWATHLVSGFIDSKAKQLYAMHLGGYTQVLNLMQYLDLLQFLLKHQIYQGSNKFSLILIISEQILKILENETQKFESIVYAPAAQEEAQSATMKSSIKYLKLEKYYLSQNKVYDPHSHTLHMETFSNTSQYFEVEELAKKDKLSQEIEQVQFGYSIYGMFVQRQPQPGQQAGNLPPQLELNPKFIEKLSPQDLDLVMRTVNQRINDYIKKLFQQVIHATDISFDYIHHLYELYPNTRLHAELIAKCLTVLCDIAVDEQLHPMFKQRSQVFFEQMQNYQSLQNELQQKLLRDNVPPASVGGSLQQPPLIQQLAPEQQKAIDEVVLNMPFFVGSNKEPNPNCCKKIDYYAVEVKSKIIAMFFKFFQREEFVIYKSAKKCLSRLIKKESNQQDALPNPILKECVRPSLNIISMRVQVPTLYEQLTRLIYVLHGCFNEQLGKHLIRCYEQAKPRLNEDFQLQMHIFKNQAANPQAGDPNNNTAQQAPFSIDNMSEQDKQRHFLEDAQRLVFQQNSRIEDIESTYHILKISYLLLQTYRHEIFKILLSVPIFEAQIVNELDKKFKDAYKQLCEFYGVPIQNNILPETFNYRPIAIKIGHLKSDFKEGLLKFCNKNPFDVCDMLKTQAKKDFQQPNNLQENNIASLDLVSARAQAAQGGASFYDYILDIANDPSSFCLRERFARDIELFKYFISSTELDSNEFSFALKLLQILVKYNPNILTLSHFQQVIYVLRPKWLQMCEIDLQQIENRDHAMYRKNYTKLMQIMVKYCCHPNAKINAIIDLARGYRNVGSIDMYRVREFFQFDAPYLFNVERNKEIVLNISERMKISNVPAQLQINSQILSPFENIAQLVDMIIVPMVTRYSDSDHMFRSLIDEKFVIEFMDAIQNTVQLNINSQNVGVTRIDWFKNELELSVHYSSEQYLTEIIKMLNLIFRYFDLNIISMACPNKDLKKLNNFLYYSAKKSKSQNLIEWSFYSVTSFFIRILNQLPAILDTDVQNFERGLQYKPTIDMIEHTADQILMLILQHNNVLFFKAIVHKSFRNLIQIIEIVNIYKQVQQKGRILRDPSIQPIRIPSNHEAVAHMLKEALIYEGRQQNSLIYLCSFILANSDTIYHYDYKFKFIQRINKIVSKLTATNTMSLSSKQLAVELCATFNNWARMRVYDYKANKPGASEIVQVYYTMGPYIFQNLARISLNVQSSQHELQKDSLDLIGHCLSQIRILLQIFAGLPIKYLPFFDNLLQEQSQQNQMMGEHENLLLVRLIMINIIYILCKYSQRKLDYIAFCFNKLLSVALRFPKGIMFSGRLVGDIMVNPDLQEIKQIHDEVKVSIDRDMKRCLEFNFDDVQRAVRRIEDKYLHDQKPPILSFQEQANCIMQVIPHYSIRLIDYYERVSHKNIQQVENDPAFYKTLIQIIHKVIINFRKHLIFDQDEASQQKLKFKHLVLHMPNNCSTKYTQVEGLVNLTNDIIEIKVDDTNYDMFNKETILIGLMLVAKKLKRMPNEEAIYILDNFISSVQYLIKFNMNEYIIEGVRKVIDILIEDKPDDVSRLTPEKKYELVRYMIQKISDLTNERKDTGKTNELIIKIYEQAVRVLEMQTSLMQDFSLKLFEKLFILSKGKPVSLKYRVFEIFERFNGCAIYKKFQFFFAKHLIDEEKSDRLAFLQAQSQFLDFTLYSFRANGDLRKIKNSSKFFSLYNLDIHIENLAISDLNDQVMQNEDLNEYQSITKSLESFTMKSNKYRGKRVSDLMSYISELISNNLSYSYDKLISDKLFLFLFHQYWSLLMTREEQQFLTEGINKHFLTCIQVANQQQQVPAGQQGSAQAIGPIDPKKYSLTRMLLEAVAGISPQIRIEPETLQLMGKTFNLWHVVLPILENHMTLFPDNERYFFATNELYDKLLETDYIAGLRRQVTKSPETRAMISFAQHDMWEEVNQQFTHFLVYYAEQEGQYEQMDDDQKRPGKYQKQIAEVYMNQLFKLHERFHQQRYQQMSSSNQDSIQMTEKEYIEKEMKMLEQELDIVSGRPKFEADKATYQYPRRGPNNLVKEVDLRIWETIFTESLKVLNKWDQYHDISRALAFNIDIPNLEMMIEYAWNQKDWPLLQTYEPLLKTSDQLKHRIYACYLAIRSQNIGLYDEVFKSIVQSAFYKWDLYLPKYIDNTVHFDNLTLYQILMESSEGGRNFIKELKDEKRKGKILDIKVLANLWRERVPHMCEKFSLWKEVLENRNFLYDQFAYAMIPTPQMPEPTQPLPQEMDQHNYKVQFIGVINSQRQDFANEYLDKAWNYYKLAQVSRKHEMPLLAISYLSILDRQLKFSGPDLPESMTYEKFRYDYEIIKVQLQFNQNQESMRRIITDYVANVENNYVAPYLRFHQKSEANIADLPNRNQPVFQPFQIASLQRLLGDYYFRNGTLDRAQKYYKDSVTLYDKDYKGWLSFAKLNHTIYNVKKDEVSLQHVIKGYMTAIELALHKSRFIIPYMIQIVKKKADISNELLNEPIALMKKLINQLPTWIWLFWIPQLLQMLQISNNILEIQFSRSILEKISKLYPQVIYQPLKIKNDGQRINFQNFNPEEQRQLNVINQAVQQFMVNIRRWAGPQIMQLDKISNEFFKTMKASPEEELQQVLSKILCMSSFFKIDNFDRDFNAFLTQLHQRFFGPANAAMSPLMAELASTYERDFINPQTKETRILQVIKRVKNLKDYLHQRINLTEQRTYLEQISPALANFSDKGIELPGQFMLSEQEPQPQGVIYIQKFDPQIHKGSNIQSRRILIKCSNQRQYTFTATNFQITKDEIHKLFNEERFNQVKLMMNMIFRKHKETAKRSIKYYVPMRAMLNRCKIVQDDLMFQSMQEIHDFLFQERGMDTDLALNIQIAKVQETLGTNMSDGLTISSLSPEKKTQINEETFQDMQTLHCKPQMLSSFFHRIFYNVDDLFLFKKYFTVHHAANSFFAYVFSQAEHFTLNQMSVCKTSGCLTFNEAKLIEFIKNRNLRKAVNNLNANPSIDFEAIEKEDMAALTYIPFRLSNNFVELMGARSTGLQGLFAGVLTSCSLAMGKYHEKLLPMLNLVYRDDLNDDREGNLLLISKSIDYIKFKMCSLSQHRNVLNLEHYLQDPAYVKMHQQIYKQKLDSQDADDQATTQIIQQPEKHVLFGNFKMPAEPLKFEVNKPNVMEEFNKKVFDLIEMAMDERRLSQMPSSWNAWF